MQSACLKSYSNFHHRLIPVFLFSISFNFPIRSYSLIIFYQSSILCTSLRKQLSDNFSSLIYFFHNLIHLKENIKWVGEIIKVFEGLYFPLYLLVALLFVCNSLHSTRKIGTCTIATMIFGLSKKSYTTTVQDLDY